VTVNPVAFYVISAAVVGAAIAVVTVPNIVHAAFALIACFFMVGALYFAIGADFLAATQILIYAGAIPVLIIFAIMLTRGSMSREGNGFVALWPVAALISMALAAGIITVFAADRGAWRSAVYPQNLLDNGTTETLGRVLLNTYALPFEVASVLLLVALVGAVVLARRDEREVAMERTEAERRARQERVRRRREARAQARAQRGGVMAAVDDGAGDAT
jgi:NADH:ubiquinone oxidoreductase subunit 6 (subunit J)